MPVPWLPSLRRPGLQMALTSGSHSVLAACHGPQQKPPWGQGLGFSPRTGDRTPQWDSVCCRQGVCQAPGSPCAFPEIIALAASSLPPPCAREKRGVQAQGGLYTRLPGPLPAPGAQPMAGIRKACELATQQTNLEIPSGERELQKATCSAIPFVSSLKTWASIAALCGRPYG